MRLVPSRSEATTTNRSIGSGVTAAPTDYVDRLIAADADCAATADTEVFDPSSAEDRVSSIDGAVAHNRSACTIWEATDETRCMTSHSEWLPHVPCTLPVVAVATLTGGPSACNNTIRRGAVSMLQRDGGPPTTSGGRHDVLHARQRA